MLSLPTLNRETETGAQWEMVKQRNQKLAIDGVGNKKQIYQMK